jgi:hypothetical protein
MKERQNFGEYTVLQHPGSRSAGLPLASLAGHAIQTFSTSRLCLIRLILPENESKS